MAARPQLGIEQKAADVGEEVGKDVDQGCNEDGREDERHVLEQQRVDSRLPKPGKANTFSTMTTPLAR